MTPLLEQRNELIKVNTELVIRWLELLPPASRYNVIESFVRRYTLPELRAMHTHVSAQVAKWDAQS